MQTDKSYPNLTEGPLFRAVWLLGVPMVATNLMQNLVSVADIYFIGKLGAEQVAAVSLGGVVIDLLWTIIAGTSMAFRALIARAAGAGKFDEANHVTHQALVLAILISVPLAIVGALLARPIAILMGAEPAVVPYAAVYFRIIIISAFLYLLTHSAVAILHAVGEARIPARAMVMITLLTLTVEPLLVFGLGPVPALGVAGGALSLALCYACTSAYLLSVLFRGHRGIKIEPSKIRPDKALLAKILRIGIPRSFERSFRAVASIAMLRIVASFGTHALAAYGVAARIFVIVLSPGWGLASVAATLVGQNLGARKLERAAKSGWLATLAYGVILLAITAFFLPFAEAIITFFTGEPEVVRHGSNLLRLTSPFYVFLALAMVLGGALGGSGDTVAPMLIAAVSLAGVQVAGALILPQLFNLQENGLWLAISCGLVSWGTGMAIWFQRGRWKQKVL